MGHVENPVCFILKQEIQEIPLSMLVFTDCPITKGSDIDFFSYCLNSFISEWEKNYSGPRTFMALFF